MFFMITHKGISHKSLKIHVCTELNYYVKVTAATDCHMLLCYSNGWTIKKIKGKKKV